MSVDSSKHPKKDDQLFGITTSSVKVNVLDSSRPFICCLKMPEI